MRLSHLLSLIFNVFRSKGSPLPPAHFDPFSIDVEHGFEALKKKCQPLLQSKPEKRLSI